jgi:predicted esterase
MILIHSKYINHASPPLTHLTMSTPLPPTDVLDEEYPTPFVVNPPSTHQNTIILLHGTSMTGPELASTLLSFPFPFPSPSLSTPPTELASQTASTTLQSSFPNTRFVFPTGKQRTTTVFGGKVTNAWFDIHAFHDRTVGESSSCLGISQTLAFLLSLIVSEIEILDAKPESVSGGIVMGGFSQGCAMGISLLLSGFLGTEGVRGRVVGFVGMSGWMPFRKQTQDAIQTCKNSDMARKREAACKALGDILSSDFGSSTATVDIPMYFTHGKLDVKVKMEWSRQMTSVLDDLGAENLERVEMEGVGHWYGVDGMVGLVGFLKQILN